MTTARLFLAACPSVDAQLAKISPPPRAGLVQVLVTRPNHAAVSHRRSRSMSISPRDTARHHQPCGAVCHFQGRFYDFGTDAEEVPDFVGSGEAVSSGNRVVGLSEVDAADKGQRSFIEQPADFRNECCFASRIPHDRPCIEHDRRTIRFQGSAPYSGSTSYQPSFPKARTLTIPIRPKSTRVPGKALVMPLRCSRYRDVMPSGSMFSSQNFLNSAIAASLSSRVRWSGLHDSCAADTGSASSRLVLSSTPRRVSAFHVIATPFISRASREQE